MRTPEPNTSSPSIARSLLRILGPAVLAVAALSVGLGLWWANRDIGSTGATLAGLPSKLPEAGRQPDAIEDRLQRARLALNERRLLAPAGDNAIEHYLQLLALDPKHLAARQALLELIPPATAAVEARIATGELVETRRQFDLLKRMGVSELGLGPLRVALAQAESAAEAKIQAEAQAVAQAEAAAKAEASAAVAPTVAANPTVAAAPPPSPPNPAPAARTMPPPAPVATAPDSAQQIAAAPSSPTATSSVASADPPARLAPTPSVQEPRQIVDARPAYPSAALQRRVEGWVELELALGLDGKVSAVKVLRSEPPRIFDREAMRAAQRWRFEPRRENGVAVATRVRKTLSFKLNSG